MMEMGSGIGHSGSNGFILGQIRYTESFSFPTYVFQTFYFGTNTLDKVAYQIIQSGFNNLRLTII